ncbi:hypothetical protein [Clostridium sporogenes]|nr:hypothetical protein [Clostridium sporogenes]EHN16544.1 hypothetical protein IYC_03419 [Clostridium sporogenes PA 3679]MDU4599015.1 hypothetical protein [Clostridium sporogenes]
MKENEARILKDIINYIMPFVKEKHVEEELEDILFQINCLVKADEGN